MNNFILLQGGFLGVDIFLVISGYLICSNIIDKIQNGGFSFYQFYSKRAQRLLPVLYTMLFVVIIIGYFLSSPRNYKEISEAIFATILLGSNFYFYSRVGYTDESSSLKPLLHNWSLSLEEQFYFIFPIFFVYFFKRNEKNLLKILIIVFIISLICTRVIGEISNSLVFYTLIGRAWEFIAGILLALYNYKFPKKSISRKIDNYISLAGLISLIFCLFTYTDRGLNPDLKTIIPIISTVLVIKFTSKESITYKILTQKFIIFIGLTSYSIYVWHQPIFAFARMYSMNELTMLQKVILIIVSIITGAISWKYIETKTRNNPKLTNSKILLISLSLAIASSIILITNGAQFREKELSKSGFSFSFTPGDEILTQNNKRCHHRPIHESCEFKNDSGKGTLIIVGDSEMGFISNQIYYSFKSIFKKIIFLTHGGCFYAPGNRILNYNGLSKECTDLLNEEKTKIILKEKNSTIIIGGRLPMLLHGSRFNNQEGGVEHGKPAYIIPFNSDKPNMEFTRKSISNSYSRLLKQGHRLILIYPIPEVGWDINQKLKKIQREKGSSDFLEWIRYNRITTSLDIYLDRSKSSFDIFNKIKDNNNLLRIYPHKTFCKSNRCSTHDDKNIFYHDSNHLSDFGGKLLVNKIKVEYLKRFK